MHLFIICLNCFCLILNVKAFSARIGKLIKNWKIRVRKVIGARGRIFFLYIMIIFILILQKLEFDSGRVLQFRYSARLPGGLSVPPDSLTWFFFPLFQERSRTSAAGWAASGDLRVRTNWRAITASTPGRNRSNVGTATDASPAATI